MYSFIDGIRQRKAFAADLNVTVIKMPDQCDPGFWYQLGFFWSGVDYGKDGMIQDRTERFHQVGSERKMIVFAMVMNADVGIERGGAKVSGKSGKEEGIGVVEELIGILSMTFPCTEESEMRPVKSRGPALDIVGIAAAHERDQMSHGTLAALNEICGLTGNFSLDQFPPELFFPRKRCMDLALEHPMRIRTVRKNRIEQSCGEMV